MVMYGNEENLKDALFKFKDLMDEHGIEFVLLYGALLGACRNGRLLPWDVDIDVHVPFKSYEDFVNVDLFNLLRDAYNKGFRTVAWDNDFLADGEYFRHPEIVLLPKEQQWREYLRTTSAWRGADKFIMFWKGPSPLDQLIEGITGYIHIDCLVALKGIHPTYEYDRVLDKVKLYGETFNAPPDHIKFLSDYYGENWKDVFCSYSLWVKHRKSIIGGHIPQEVEDFMIKWKPLLEDE